MSCMESRRPCLRYYLAVICKRLIKNSMLPAFTPGMPSPCVKKLRDAWTNALPRYLRIIKSRYGFYAIFYGSFMHVRSCGGSRAFGQATTYRMVFQGSGFSFDAGMLLSALLYASSAAFFFTWSSAFGASCCCLFPFAMAWAGAVTASNVIAIAAITVLILKSFRIWTAC